MSDYEQNKIDLNDLDRLKDQDFDKYLYVWDYVQDKIWDGESAQQEEENDDNL
jgi:hypothetical protein